MGSDFSGDDEEIDEDLAFTAEDNEKYAGWFSKVHAEVDTGGELDGLQEKYNTDDFSEVSPTTSCSREIGTSSTRTSVLQTGKST